MDCLDVFPRSSSASGKFFSSAIKAAESLVGAIWDAQMTIITSTMKDMFAAYVWENVYIKEMGFETILKVQKRSNTSFADKFP